ncbi:MAG: ECF transporter S component [Promethearchaeota archaeon]
MEHKELNDIKEKDEIALNGAEIDQDGFYKTSTFMKKNKILWGLTLNELLYCAILGVMGGFISSLVPFDILMKAVYPFIGGTQLTSGHHLVWMSIAYGVTRKKSAPIVTALIKGILESALGDSWGALVFFINLLEGGSLLFGFILVEKFGESETKLGWALAGGLGNFTQAPFFWWINGRYGLVHWSLVVVAFIFAFLSGSLIPGLLGREIVKYINSGLDINEKK